MAPTENTQVDPNSNSPFRDPASNSTNIPALTTKRASRNIIILLDGTGNEFSAKNSNVIKLMSVLEVDEKQLIYYSSGIGESSVYNHDSLLHPSIPNRRLAVCSMEPESPLIPGTILPAGAGTWSSLKQSIAKVQDMGFATCVAQVLHPF
jgi:hypothetical protein